MDTETHGMRSYAAWLRAKGNIGAEESGLATINELDKVTQDLETRRKMGIGVNWSCAVATAMFTILAYVIMALLNAITAKITGRSCVEPACSLALTSPRRVARCACTPVARRGKTTGYPRAATRATAARRTRTRVAACHARSPWVENLEARTLDAEDVTGVSNIMKEVAMRRANGNGLVHVYAKDASLRKRKRTERATTDFLDTTAANRHGGKELRRSFEEATNVTQALSKTIEHTRTQRTLNTKYAARCR
jgi:hypothetical protein